MDNGYTPTIINIDLNTTLNIRAKGWFILNGLNEPSYMSRSVVMK
jgi:hypothetical protein